MASVDKSKHQRIIVAQIVQAYVRGGKERVYTNADIAEALQVPVGTAGAITAQLEDAGFLTRAPTPEGGSLLNAYRRATKKLWTTSPDNVYLAFQGLVQRKVEMHKQLVDEAQALTRATVGWTPQRLRVVRAIHVTALTKGFTAKRISHTTGVPHNAVAEMLARLTEAKLLTSASTRRPMHLMSFRKTASWSLMRAGTLLTDGVVPPEEVRAPETPQKTEPSTELSVLGAEMIAALHRYVQVVNATVNGDLMRKAKMYDQIKSSME